MNDTDVLLKFSEEEWSQARQSEDQRALVTNLIMTVASVIIGVISQRGLDTQTLPLTFLLVTLGLYGGLTSRKLYERHQFHIERARRYRARINELHPNAQLNQLREEAVTVHKSKFPYLYSVHLNWLWSTLYAVIVMAGVILTIIALG